jgi:hypothetical protein
MTILFDEMVNDLIADVPPRDGVPSNEQFERMVKEAVRDFGRRTGRIKESTIDVVAGTAMYDLPEDFLRMIVLHGLHGHDGIINTSNGLIAVGHGMRERYTIMAGTITFYPTPVYTLTRRFSYKAGWALSSEDYGAVYAELTDEEAEIALLKAKAMALEMQANATAGDGWRYAIGDESVDKSGQQSAYKVRLETAEGAYEKAVAVYNGNTGLAG